MSALALALISLVTAQAGQAEPAPRRYALVVGSNVGDAAEEPLRYAEADARHFLEVMRSLSGVREGDSAALYAPDEGHLEQALAAMDQQLAREGRPQDQLIVYVSAHADEGQLHLGGTHFSLARLTGFLERAPVGVAVLVLDSCRSGSVTRVKGLEPLAKRTVTIEVPEVTGRVWISSSGADEYAQESDSLGASFFTHYLLAGLRGAADDSADGRVTLQEVYAYAYGHTVGATFATRTGVQHPSYRVELHGRADLVMSEPAHGDSRLALGVDEPGHWVVTSEGGRLFAEVDKPRGRAVLAAPPGRYLVRWRRGGDLWEASVQVPAGGEVLVLERDLTPSAAVATARKGGARRVALLAGASLDTGVVSGLGPLAGAQLAAELGLRGPWFLSASVTGRAGRANGDVTFSHRELSLRVGGGAGWWLGAVRLSAALEAGATVVWQAGLPGEGARIGVEPSAQVVLRGRLPLDDRLGLYAELSGGPALVRGVDALRLAFAVGGTVGASLSF